VETAYTEAAVAFARDSGVEQLQVRGLERGSGVGEGEIVSLAAARVLVRRLLREDLVCKLEAPDDRFAVHVGFDLYMYVGSTAPCEAAQRQTRALGLFVEPAATSPLWVADDE